MVTELPNNYKVKPPAKEIFLERQIELVALNFSLDLVKRIVRISDTKNGEVYAYVYVIRVIVHKMDGSFETFVAAVSSDKVKSVEWLKLCTHSLAKIPSRKEEKEILDIVNSKING